MLFIFIQKIFKYNSVVYCFDTYIKLNNIKSKGKHLQNLPHNDIEKTLRTKHKIQVPGFFALYELIREFITKNNRKIDLYNNDFDFIIIFLATKNFRFMLNLNDKKPNIFYLKMLWVLWLEIFIRGGYRISPRSDRSITTIIHVITKTNEIYTKKPKSRL